METIRVLLADDEKPARSRLIDLLEKQPDIQIVGVAHDGREAATLIRSQHPDLVFLDIQMPDLDGFDVLRQIGPACIPVTVFVTAYDKYAIRAFEAHALDYLLKPFSDERFEASLERARNQIHTLKAGELARRISGLLADTVAAEPPPDAPLQLQRLVVRSGGRVTFLKVEEIDWIEAAGVYVYLHTAGKAILYRATVGQLQARLDSQRFVRVHRSAVINTERIRELQPRSHGDYVVVLKDGTEVALSRSYRSALEKWLRQPL
jgi:two-component system, LytTR family, response regulator